MAVERLQSQLHVLRMQYRELKRIHASQTGSYRRGKLGLDAALRASYVVPGSWQDVVGQQRRGVYGRKKKQASHAMHYVSPTQFKDVDGSSAQDYAMGTDAVLSSMAVGEATFEAINVHLKNMRKFARRIDQTRNSKEAQDLRNRIAVEQGMLQSAKAKLAVVHLHLQAQLLHRHHQSVMVNHRFFNLLK
jgi:type IV secretion system protein VirB5